MRDDLPLRPAFDAASGDEDYPLDLKFSHIDPVQPDRPSRAWRIFSFGALGACVLGLGLGLMTFKGRAATPAAKPAAPLAAANFQPIKAAYAAPDREQVARALAESKRLMAAEGLSGLARASIVCFDKLSREPAYSLMDYCLALDLLGAQAYAQAAGDTAPPSTYFGQGPVRRQGAVQMLIAGQTDANSRLIDTNRLVQELVLQAQIAAAPPQPAADPAAPQALAALAVAEVEPPPPPPAPAAVTKPAETPVVRPVPPRVLVRAAKPPVAAPRQLLRRPVKAVRAEPKVRPLKKTAAQPVRVRKSVRKAVPPPRIAAAPLNAEPKQSWPEILLTRLQGGEGKPNADSRPPPAAPVAPRSQVRPVL